MSKNSKCILVTGAGHSGTRLVMDMLSRHPDVWVPTPFEFAPLHHFFIRTLDVTPLYAPQCTIDRDEFRFILDAYMQNVDQSRPHFSLKLPYYPLNCLGFFHDYFAGNVRFLLTRRPVEKVIKSYLDRGEDRLLFSDNPVRWVKKLEVDKRQHFLATNDAQGFFREVIAYCDRRRREWDNSHPESPFVEIDIERIATSKDDLMVLLQRLDLSTDTINDMMSVVDTNRLLYHKRSPDRWEHLKHFVKGMIPPFFWSLISRPLRKL